MNIERSELVRKNKKDVNKILNETKVFINKNNGQYGCLFGPEFDSHDWYTVDEAEIIIENALSKTEHYTKINEKN